ncbi:hypothetical protein BAUCODRAFT_28610 [Baudoinia panamericana UAMH 10762]|uniref:Uncharacterized protein n=1 Tax=Baudoinia panamericana (strain UAMH 10762) TaxID=717646 RepID=M2MYY6_BAUPA|nr:uncharacterized protein BAUCODRAFT_28610 [Baudoinia panamericana UAMH 10762]EMC91515.1 hypothetical protein BAUCODRAFT_28610 [Baudoinia panamericana UAMH 10762]
MCERLPALRACALWPVVPCSLLGVRDDEATRFAQALDKEAQTFELLVQLHKSGRLGPPQKPAKSKGAVKTDRPMTGQGDGAELEPVVEKSTLVQGSEKEARPKAPSVVSVYFNLPTWKDIPECKEKLDAADRDENKALRELWFKQITGMADWKTDETLLRANARNNVTVKDIRELGDPKWKALGNDVGPVILPMEVDEDMTSESANAG